MIPMMQEIGSAGSVSFYIESVGGAGRTFDCNSPSALEGVAMTISGWSARSALRYHYEYVEHRLNCNCSADN